MAYFTKNTCYSSIFFNERAQFISWPRSVSNLHSNVQLEINPVYIFQQPSGCLVELAGSHVQLVLFWYQLQLVRIGNWLSKVGPTQVEPLISWFIEQEMSNNQEPIANGSCSTSIIHFELEPAGKKFSPGPLPHVKMWHWELCTYFTKNPGLLSNNNGTQVCMFRYTLCILREIWASFLHVYL